MRVLKDFAEGIGLYWRGARAWSADPFAMAIGLLPGLITMMLFIAAFVALGWGLDGATAWVADRVVGADSAAHGAVQFVAALALIGGSVLIAVYAFVSVTTVVGQPFFEKVSHRVDSRLGPAPVTAEWPWWRNAVRGVGEGLRLSLLTVPLSGGLVVLGLIPGLGTAASWTLGVLFGGWFVALEFTAIAFERRGMVLADRRRILAVKRARTLGFGAMAFVMSAVPPLAILTMPSAIAGGTLLARRAIDEDSATDSREQRGTD